MITYILPTKGNAIELKVKERSCSIVVRAAVEADQYPPWDGYEMAGHDVYGHSIYAREVAPAEMKSVISELEKLLVN